jgi:hypothetical protein
MFKGFHPAPHVAGQQRRVSIGILGDRAIYNPTVTGLKNQAYALFRQLAQRSVDGSLKRIKHCRHSHAVLKDRCLRAWVHPAEDDR